MGLVRELFEEYARGLDVDLSFQNFRCEIESLPYEYDPILVAYEGDRAAGCVAMRKIVERICEMKRLYVRNEFRGKGIGSDLATAIISEARTRGFERMRLDTLPSMREAQQLYTSLRFREISPYRLNPIVGSRFMELVLR